MAMGMPLKLIDGQAQSLCDLTEASRGNLAGFSVGQHLRRDAQLVAEPLRRGRRLLMGKRFFNDLVSHRTTLSSADFEHEQSADKAYADEMRRQGAGTH